MLEVSELPLIMVPSGCLQTFNGAVVFSSITSLDVAYFPHIFPVSCGMDERFWLFL